MESWESSGQWPFSCYAPVKASISGFTDLSPEELRLEYYTSRAAGALQNYVNAVQQLANQWRSRVQELKNPDSNTRVALISELKNPQSASLGFPSTGSVFGGAGFNSGGSQATGGTGFGSPASQAPAGFGSAPSAASFSFASSSAPTASLFGSGSTPAASSQSSGSTPTAASFSFRDSTSSGESSASAGAAAGSGGSAADFGLFASGFGASLAATTAPGGLSFGQPAGGAGPAASGAGPSGGGSAVQLFTPQGELTAEELKEFSAKRFTLGQVPLRPPPAELLVV